MHTTHGHHIPGSHYTDLPAEMLRCGGVIRCSDCQIEAGAFNLLHNPREADKTTAMHLARCFIDGFYLVRDESVPVYDLHVTVSKYRESDGQWMIYVQPIGSPHTEVKIHYMPHIRKYGVSGSFILSVILVNEADV